MRSRLAGAALVVAAMALATLVGVVGAIPVTSQTLRLEAAAAPAAVPLDDPWADVWFGVTGLRVPLSAQAVEVPFGGGTVPSLIARAMHDDGRIYLLVEWADETPDDSVNSSTAFSDAAALQFPAQVGSLPPYTMGAADSPVNIWQWKAVWQADLDGGFATGRDRYPDTYSDEYPNADDPNYRPAAAVGNPLAQETHASSVENLIAEGFGTLTTADVQDVDGSGAWREGRWRALFARDLETATPGAAAFAVGEQTLVAFAVWDGGAGDRNGQKSVAQFVEMDVSAAGFPAPGSLPAGGAGGAEPPWPFLIGVFALVAAVLSLARWSMSRSHP